MTAVSAGFGMWGVQVSARCSSCSDLPHERNTAMLAGELTTVGLTAMSQGAEFI